MLSAKPMQRFHLDGEMVFFEKSSAPSGKQRRIAGIISTEIKDKQDEIVLQNGLDFSYFLSKGFFNDNHSKKTGGVLGYPERVQRFAKGERLPDGSTAKANLTWSEGYLLNTPDATKVWEVAQALKKSDGQRQLGFSLEGEVEKRTGPGNKTIAKAVIRHVAITQCPVGEETRLEALDKAEALAKALTMGTSETGAVPDVPLTGDGAGALLVPRDVEGDDVDEEELRERRKLAINNVRKGPLDDDEDGIGGMSKSMAAAYVQMRLPYLAEAQAVRVVDAVIRRSRNMKMSPTIEALEKAMAELNKSALASPNRQKELFRKAEAGTITAEERRELAKSVEDGSVLGTAATAAFHTDTIEKSTEASGYLADHAAACIKGFKVIAEQIEKSQSVDEERWIGLARVVKAQNELIKSMAESIDTLMGQPAAAPRAAGTNGTGKGGQDTQKPLAKSFGDTEGKQPSGESAPLVKALDGSEHPVPNIKQAIRAMGDMMIKGGIKTIAGQPIERLVTRAESAGEIRPDVLGEVAKHIAQQKGAA